MSDNPIWRVSVVEALKSLGGQAPLSEIYQAIKEIREPPLPPSWEAIVRRELEYNSSDSESFQNRHNLFYSVDGLGHGVWGLREIEPKTIVSREIEPNFDERNKLPGRSELTTYRILRDSRITRQLKILYNNRCQICNEVFRFENGQPYSEAHHIRPLGNPHNGPDIASNVIILCPNHHAMCDYGGIKLDLGRIKLMLPHRIEEAFIKYHNEKIWTP
ncbi:MAG: HNH endonuclease [Alphaproteobacteria bacterium]|nr:MAG: HNH endonuclease [Alphaproteobacteria bacterium]